MRLKFDRLTPSQEAVYSYVSRSTRWLTTYEISMLTGVSEESTRLSMKQLLDNDLVLVRKRIYGFENGEREFKHASSRGRVANACEAARARNHPDITGVEPLTARLRRILGKAKARQFAEYLK